VYVGVCEGGVGRIDCGFVLLHSIFYIQYSKFYNLCSLMTVVHGVVLRERTSLRQPVQVLGSQDVGVSGPIIICGNNDHSEGLYDGMRNVRL